MGLSAHLLLLLLFLPFCFCDDPIGQYCGKSFGSGGSGQIQSTINHVLSDLVAGASVGGFATSSSGHGNNIVYGLAQCRGDVAAGDCSACLSDAAKKLPAACPNQADARIWYDYCFVRYDTDNFIGVADTGYAIILINVENATDPEAFDRRAGALMTQVRAQSAVPGSGGLGRGKAQFAPYVTIYGLTQCTRDLQPLACEQCLASAVETLPVYCRYRKGCRVLYSSCIARYEIYPFFFPLDSSQSAAVGHQSKLIFYP